MSAPRVALLAPGEMGAAVGARLIARGARVTTCLAGRGARSAALASAAGLSLAPDLPALLAGADIVLSIVPPGAALALAQDVAAAARQAGAAPLFVDCNAVAPETVRAVAAVVAEAGMAPVDAGIVGAPPHPTEGGGPRFYASGAEAARFAALSAHGLDIRVVGAEIGQASAVKCCYAALTKGFTALGAALLVAAERAGVAATLAAEFAASQPEASAWLLRQLPSMPPKAWRWVAEMEEIGAFLDSVGVPGTTLRGAAELYRKVAATPLGQETPETRDRSRDGRGVAEALARTLG
jgi:3-hydroxyisobutyrate dehydrogenase-like beta-hydroxyacid dehydrogenase